MLPQIAYLRRGIVTLAAFVWLFSTVRLKMCPQIVCPKGCKVTLVAFVQPFSTVCFHVSLQIGRLRGAISTLVAFVGRHIIIKVIFAIINIHNFLQFDASSFASSVKLTQKREIEPKTFLDI